MSDLLPCPFCGGKPSTWESAALLDRVTCIKCLAEIKGDSLAEAIAAWNTRQAVPVEANREARLVDALNELRSCSRAKIGMEDDFACADKQMRDALAAYQAETGAAFDVAKFSKLDTRLPAGTVAVDAKEVKP